MAGRHTRQPAAASLFGPVATAVVVLALLVSGAFGALKLTEEKSASTVGRIEVPQSTEVAPSAETPSPTVAAVTPTPTTTPKPKTTRSPEHTSRGSVRPPSSKKPTPEKTTTSKPATGGSVVSSGTCGASYYDEGQTTANGEAFNPDALTAAHKTLPFNTRVRVTNPSNGKSVVVRINDRGPFVSGRCIDLSRAAFAAIASLSQGELTVKYDILDN
ncbi:rare lipoprotein A [Asanoa ishikariensis]|uniref:Probable endolytic peptidoglycan transglycosylase RlpA n=1 Tax=Asanoa ishikariensis TaxID=137265 RepID=A0A1H3UWJ2_9ACTN|nr:septal ring lytic transglycosylase RlpA family protein [Asanoa ishikariensis]SDZ66812.1 rare lipoprotein A [Asanoa ishikariensis]